MKAPIDNFVPQGYPKGSITQFFGENPDLYAFLDLKGHNGIDIVSTHGSPMYAVEAGTVVETRYDPSGYGKHVRFISDGVDAREWTYGHCNAVTVEVGDRVEEGDLIATMGNTGFVVSAGIASTFWGDTPRGTKGTHLHFGLREVKRNSRGWSYPDSTIKIDVKNYDNGYKGAVDPFPLVKNLSSSKISNDEEKITILKGIVSLWQKIIKKQ